MAALAWMLVAAAAGLLSAAEPVCPCGSHPPGAPAKRSAAPYAGTPEDMRPFSRFTKPYHEHYQDLVEYNGAARDVPEPQLSEVRIGFLGPVENHPDEALGRMMLSGAQLAVEQANARGGYCGKPFRLMVHNDQAIWGASSNEIVKMCYDDQVWAILGSLSGDSTHIGLRVALKTEVPIVNSAATDPTIPETIIPWYLTVLQDDRVQCYTLARRIYTELGLKRVALLRVNDRYGRFGVIKFRDASRRLGHPVAIEQKFMPGDTDFRRQLEVIRDSGVDGVVLWADAAPAGTILKQMREMGMAQPVFGSFRVLGDALLQNAGSAADGLEAVFPYDPTRDDPLWRGFNQAFARRFQKPPETFASLAYDAMGVLLQSICRAGLNRGRIRDALTATEHYKGVTGEMTFDPNCKNVVPMFLATVKGGRVTYRRATMEKPYAAVREDSPAYTGPAIPDLPRGGPWRIGIFGPRAEELAATGPLARLARDSGGRFVIQGVSADVPWGKASNELVRLIHGESTLGVVATDRASAHLAEQLAAKLFVPVVALSADRSLTSVNLPWIFRLPPDTAPERAVRYLIEAADKAGPNRGRVRDVLAASGRFDALGEPK